MKYFIKAQGFTVYDYVMYQDKLSAIILEKNECELGSQITKHIQVRYFLIKYYIADGDKTLEHCPMVKMLGDHSTKPLQAFMFRKYHAYIQLIPDYTGEFDMCWGEASEPVIPILQYFFGFNDK